MEEICIFASDLSTILGLNKYNKKSEVLIKLWKNNNRTDYDNILNIINNSNYNLIIEESELECINRLSKKANLDIKKNLDKCLTANNTDKLHDNRKKILNKIIKSKLPEKDKDLFRKNIVKKTNTNFGTINENSVIKFYENITNTNIIKTNKFIKKKVIKSKGYIWSVGGRLDGIDENGKIIEIKNRINKLFNKLQDYEKPQLYAYMYIMNSKESDLIECIKKENNEIINIINHVFDENYWTEIIENGIKKFSIIYKFFIENLNIKILALTDINKFDTILNNL